jgi:hypothetical protein
MLVVHSAVSISGEDADAGDMLSGEEVTDQDREAESSDDEAQEAPMILEEALRDPIYLVSLDPEVKACITCPGKLLKNAKMSDIHLSSQVRDSAPFTYPVCAHASHAGP